ncbi:MAG: group II intron reverse transcriptase domain-containing protein [Pirellulaceae bacterium]|nr:group II intron reverse transcriptase domain-containing protein [Pirellulaceae bacterium]
MKRTGNLFDDIAEWKNLHLACYKALRGKRTRPDARAFTNKLDENLNRMVAQLRAGCIPVGRAHRFVIHDPKLRLITAPCFEERVLHHAVMNVCEPVLERWLIHDTYACRTGKGREAAILRAQCFARRYPYFLKMDVRKYFESVPHAVLLERLERLFKDQRLLHLFARILAGHQGEMGRGLPIGSLTSQHLANFYLGWFDRYVKETLRVKGYVRYMDDMLLWGESPRAMQVLLDCCRDFLGEKLGLQLKPHPYINRREHGVDFLGCRVLPDHVVLSRRSKLRFRRKMTRLEQSWLDGLIDERQLQERATSLVAFTDAAGAKSCRFRRAVLQQLPVSGRRPATG